MTDSKLEAIVEESLPMDANPRQVLQALKTLNNRVAAHQKNEPGNYTVTEPTAFWRSTLSSSWILSVTLYRSPSEPVPEPPKTTPKT